MVEKCTITKVVVTITSRNQKKVKCSHRECSGDAWECADGSIELGEEHVCDIDNDFALKKQMLQEMFKRIETCHDGKISLIFHDVHRQMGPHVKLDYSTYRTRLLKQYHKNRPPTIPTILRGLSTALQDYEPFIRNFRGEVTSTDGGTAVLFSNDGLIAELNDSSEIFVDGTFKVCPKVPNMTQVFVVYTVNVTKGTGVVYGLTHGQSKDLYIAIMTRLLQLAPRLRNRLRMVHGDYELAIIAAIQELFPNVRFAGCWFHYCNANLRKLRSYGKDVPARFLGMIYAVPLLPIDRYNEARDIIEDEATILGLRQFFMYFDRTWLQRRELICVEGVRTNAHIENGNRLMKARFGVHPQFWNFIDHLNDLLEDNRIQLTSGPRRTSQRQIQRNNYISHMQNLIRNNSVTVENFLTSFYESEEERVARLELQDEE